VVNVDAVDEDLEDVVEPPKKCRVVGKAFESVKQMVAGVVDPVSPKKDGARPLSNPQLLVNRAEVVIKVLLPLEAKLSRLLQLLWVLHPPSFLLLRHVFLLQPQPSRSKPLARDDVIAMPSTNCRAFVVTSTRRRRS
jgi:hypothetical protein